MRKKPVDDSGAPRSDSNTKGDDGPFLSCRRPPAQGLNRVRDLPPGLGRIAVRRGCLEVHGADPRLVSGA
jgi:hypothetical protein